MRRFMLDRIKDVSGSSGIGYVAEGVEFSDGAVAMRWLVPPYSTGFYGSVDDVKTIHGHGQQTNVLFLDLSPHEMY